MNEREQDSDGTGNQTHVQRRVDLGEETALEKMSEIWL